MNESEVQAEFEKVYACYVIRDTQKHDYYTGCEFHGGSMVPLRADAQRYTRKTALEIIKVKNERFPQRYLIEKV